MQRTNITLHLCISAFNYVVASFEKYLLEKHSYELLRRLQKEHTVYPLLYDNKEGRFRFFLSLRQRVRKLLKAHPTIKIVYVNDGLLAIAMAWLKKERDIKMVATVHGLDVVHPNQIYQYLVKKNLTKFDKIIAVSSATAQACIQRGLDSKKIFVVKNGVDHELAEVPIEKDFLTKFEEKYHLTLKGKQVLVTMGRPVKRKGFSWFVKDVMPQLKKDVVFLLIGPRAKKTKRYWHFIPSFIKRQIELSTGISTDGTALRIACSNPNLQQKVMELGKLPFPEVLQLLAHADLFIMPNIPVEGDMEGFGLVALESAIRTTPVVASNIEGITDAVINEKNGYLLPPKDPAAWVQKIHQILKNKEQLNAFSLKARQFTLDQYSWALMVKGYMEVFDS